MKELLKKIYEISQGIHYDISKHNDGIVTGKGSYDYMTHKQVSELLNKNNDKGLVITHAIDNHQIEKDGKVYVATVSLTVTIHCSESGESLSGSWVGVGVNFSDPSKALYSAISSGIKYFIMKTFSVSVNDENDDNHHGNSTDSRRQVKQQPRQKPRQKPVKPDASTPLEKINQLVAWFHASKEHENWYETVEEYINHLGGRDKIEKLTTEGARQLFIDEIIYGERPEKVSAQPNEDEPAF